MTARDTDNSPAGIDRRARHAEITLMNEVRLLGGEVGADMALCAMLGAAHHYAKETGVEKERFVCLVVDLLHSTMIGKGRK
jgi:hypothetical protein